MTVSSLEQTHVGIGLAAVADAFSGTSNSDVFSMENYGLTTFLIHWGVGTTGTTVITVESCDDFTPTTTTAIPFQYKRITSPDTQVALVEAAAAGFTTTAGSNQIYVVEVASQQLVDGHVGVRINAAESANDPLLGGILVVQSQPRFAQDETVVSTS
jgi:hypothetical protein